METILLTSAGTKIKEEICKIIPKSARIAYITTASKVEKSIFYVEEDRQALMKSGFIVEDIDIEGKKENELRALLMDKDVIYVQGGNPFYLLKSVKASGFDIIVKELVKKGVIYVGVSAGSYIACPTIEMAYWKQRNRDNFGVTDLTGMALVPFLVSVHFEPEYKEIIKKEISKTKYPVRILTDKQAILVRGGQACLVGYEEEVKL